MSTYQTVEDLSGPLALPYLAAVVDDGFGYPLLLIDSEEGVPARVWQRAYDAGVILIVHASNGWAMKTSDFVEERTERASTAEYLFPQHRWVKEVSFPSLDEFYAVVLGVIDPQPVQFDVEQVDPDGPDLGEFVHLHTHTEYSALDGLTTMTEYGTVVVEQGGKAFGSADHGNCAGHPEQQQIADKMGLHPVFGMEAYFVPDRFRRSRSWVELDGREVDENLLTPEEKKKVERRNDSVDVKNEYTHLTLWAQGQQGLRNVWAMSTESYRDGLYDGKPRLDWDTLNRLNHDVLCGTGCLRGPVSRKIQQGDLEGARDALLRLLGIFGDRLYVEIHTNQLEDQKRVNQVLVELATEYRIPLLAVVDSHYPVPDKKRTHQIWLSMQVGKTLEEDTSLFQGNQDYHLKDVSEVRVSLKQQGLSDQVIEEAVANTVRLARRCTAQVRGATTTPTYSRASADHPDPIKRDVERVFEICFENWARRTRGKSYTQQEAMDRMEREMRLLISKQFCGYFLVVWDYVSWAKNEGCLVGPSRGSGGGSFVAYLMGITETDPIEQNLIFERFLTEGRTSLPDFDIDFPSSWRSRIVSYIIQRWGEDYTSNIGTVLRLRSKAAINDVFRTLSPTLPYEIPFKEIDDLKKAVEEADRPLAGKHLPWDEFCVQFADLVDPMKERYPEFFDAVEQVMDRLKSYGKHAAGVVISTEHPLTDLPMRLVVDKETKTSLMVTQFDMVALEELGYVKFDILTLRTLDTLQECVDLIAVKFGRRINPYDWVEEYQDPQVWEEVSAGRTLGLFQVETASGTRMIKRMQPASVDDLAAVVTVVRPGPMRSGLTDSFLRRRAGAEPVTYPDPRMESFVGDTYACFAGDTRVVTRDGTFPIAELAGGSHHLMSSGGRWIESEIRSFGSQPLMRLTLRRNKQTKIIHATQDHRWFARWSDTKSRAKEIHTEHLQPGMVLSSQMPRRAGRGTTPSPFGIAAGATFGDGSRTRWSAHLNLHGKKDAELRSYFAASRIDESPSGQERYSEPFVRVLDLPRSWKDLPSLDEGESYLYGWLAGYFAADGCVSTSGSAMMTSHTKAHLEHFRTIANRVGIGTYGIATSERTKRLPDGSTRTQEVHTMGLVRSTLRPEFFVLSEHRSRFLTGVSARGDRVQWTVVSVEETDRVEEVYCAIVPETHSFVLDDHILTGNCMIYQEQVMSACMVLAGYDSNEADSVRSILGKKKVEKIPAAGQEFIKRAVENDTHPEVASHLWEQMAEFAKYGFNRAHAYAYAVVGYWTAWLKFHFPVEFLLACLSTVDMDRIPEFVEEVRSMGYGMKPPDINRSKEHFSADGLDVVYGLASIKGIGWPTAQQIVSRQPYSSIDDFVERCIQKQPGETKSAVDMGHLRILVAVGAFDSLVDNRRAVEMQLEREATGEATRCVNKTDTPVLIPPVLPVGVPANAKDRSVTLPCSFDWANEPDPPMIPRGRGKAKVMVPKAIPKSCTVACRQYVKPPPLTAQDVQPYTEGQILDRERELLGIWISCSPWDRIADQSLIEKSWTASMFENAPTDTQEAGVCIVEGLRTRKDTNGREYAFVTMNLQDGRLDMICFADLWADVKHCLTKDTIGAVVVRKGSRGYQMAAYTPIQISA